MFYTKKVKQDIDLKLQALAKSIRDTSGELLERISGLTEKEKVLYKRVITLDNRIDKLEAKLSTIENNLLLSYLNKNSTSGYDMLKAQIAEKHRQNRIKQGQEIVNKGQKIIETRNKLFEEMIARQRKGENVFNLKFRIEVYDEIIGGLK